MEEKELYTQSEISQMLGKSLSGLAFYKPELKEKGFIVTQNGKDLISKEGLDYLKLRFSEQAKSKPKKEENKGSNENTKVENTIDEKDLEIAKLKTLNEALQDKNEYLNSQVLKWENECNVWQANVKQTNEDKQFWQDFATKELGTIKDKLLPEVTNQNTTLAPTPQKRTFFSKFKKRR